MQQPLKHHMSSGSGFGCGLPVQFNATGFMPGLFCKIKKRAAAAAHIKDPAQIFFPGEPEGPREFWPIQCVIPCVLNLAIERFITREPGVKEGKITPLATIQLHRILFMNLSPGVRRKFLTQLLPKLS